MAAAAFAPFIAGVHPSFFGLDSFAELERPLNLRTGSFEQVDYSSGGASARRRTPGSSA